MEKKEADKLFEKSLRELEEAGANMRCDDLTRLLEKLGFSVRKGNKGGHRPFAHPKLPGFHGASFNCGHGKNPEIKRSYIKDASGILREYEDQIKEYLRGTKL